MVTGNAAGAVGLIRLRVPALGCPGLRGRGPRSGSQALRRGPPWDSFTAPGGGMAVRLFLSFSRMDAAQVEELIRDLEHAHLSVWRGDALRGGDRRWQGILEHIRQSDLLIFALSDNSLRSKPCLSELSYARALGVPVLPVQVGSVEELRTTPFPDVQVIDYRQRTVPHGVRLIAAVQGSAARRRPQPDRLPDPPPVPFEYLLLLGSAISAAQLTPGEQADLIRQVREGLETEEDESAREDARDLLTALRRRSDMTFTNAQDVDRLLADLPDVETATTDVGRVGRHSAVVELQRSLAADGGRPSPSENDPPRGRRLRERMNRRTTAVVAGLLGLLTVVALILFLVPGSFSPAPSALREPASAPAPVTTVGPTPTPTPTSSLAGVFSGRARAGGIGLSIVVDSGKATAYLCDGHRFEEWLQGTVSGDQIHLTGRGNASLVGTVNAQGLSGQITTPAGQIPFLAEAARAPAGVYRAEIELNGSDAYIGWAVLADGTQLGVIDTNGGGLPAPQLDLATGNFTLNGQTHHADRVPAGAALPTS